MPVPLEYFRVFSDADGESHIHRCELSLETKRFAPPAPALDVSTFFSAAGFAALRLPPDWWGEWHPSPYRQWLFFMSGAASLHVTDGSQCEVKPGSIVLLEDTSGRGHRTRVIGGDEVLIASVRQDVSA